MGALLMLGSCDRRQRHWYSSSPKSLWSISLNISAIKLTWNQHTRAVSRDKAEYIMRERERITTHLTAVPRLRRLGLQQWGQRHDRQIESSGGVKNHRRSFWKWQITILDDRKETVKLGVFSGVISCIPMHNIYKLLSVSTSCFCRNFAQSSSAGTRFHTSGNNTTTVSILSPERYLSSAILCLQREKDT